MNNLLALYLTTLLCLSGLAEPPSKPSPSKWITSEAKAVHIKYVGTAFTPGTRLRYHKYEVVIDTETICEIGTYEQSEVKTFVDAANELLSQADKNGQRVSIVANPETLRSGFFNYQFHPIMDNYIRVHDVKKEKADLSKIPKNVAIDGKNVDALWHYIDTRLRSDEQPDEVANDVFAALVRIYHLQDLSNDLDAKLTFREKLTVRFIPILPPPFAIDAAKRSLARHEAINTLLTETTNRAEAEALGITSDRPVEESAAKLVRDLHKHFNTALSGNKRGRLK